MTAVERQTELTLLPSSYPEQSSYKSHDVMKKIGIDPFAQSERAQRLIQVLGDEGVRIAHQEYEDNQKAYTREFILDEPVSLGYKYYSHNNELYSDHAIHELTKISNSIHPNEREGRTLQGFQKFESLITNSKNRIAIWYSPAGPGGSKPPFSNLTYESGRLYLSFKKEKNTTYNFDIKIQEKNFPVGELLQYLSHENNQDLYDYLDKPFATTEEAAFFFKRLEAFGRHPAMKNDPTIYTARRNDPDWRAFQWQEILQEIKSQLREKLTHPQEISQSYSRNLSQESISKLTRADYIEASFYAQMHQHMLATGKDELFLYGCSATSIINRADYSMRALLKELRESTTPSIYSTLSRMRPSAIATLADINKRNNDIPDPTCVTCGACGHLGVKINTQGRWECPECNSVGPEAKAA